MDTRQKGTQFWLRVVIATLAILAANAIRAALAPSMGNLRFLTFFPTIIAITCYLGTPVGWVALAESVVIVCYNALNEPKTVVTTLAVSMTFYTGTGAMMVWLSGFSYRRRQERTVVDVSRLRLAAIVESSDDAILSKDLDGKIQTWNAAAARLFGFEPEDIIGQSIGRLVPADLQDDQISVLDRLRRGEPVETHQTVRLHKDGRAVQVDVTMTPLRANGGTVVGSVEILRDIGVRLQTEADLRIANRLAERNVGQLRAVIDGMSEGVVVADADGNLIEWNRPALETHGYASLDEVRRNLATFADQFELRDDTGRKLPIDEWPLPRVLRGETLTDIELSVRRVDKPLDLIVKYGGRPVFDSQGRVELAILTLHDVTEERRAQQAVRDHAIRLSLALEAGGLGDWAWDPNTDEVTLSPFAAKLFGVQPDTVNKRDAMRDLVHEADRERIRVAAAQSMANGGDYDMEYRVVHPDRTIWVATRGRAQFDANGNITRMIGVVQDITPRKLAEEQIRDNREWLELAVAIAQTGTFQVQHNPRKIEMNKIGRAIYGVGADEILTGEILGARIHPDDVKLSGERFRASLDPNGSRQFQAEHRAVRPDGQTRWVRCRGRTLFEETPAGMVAERTVGTFIDVTEEKESAQQREHLLTAEQAARHQAEHASRMKDEFLATLSHELRTPLNAILGWAEILAGGGSPAEISAGLEVIRRNARSQAQIIEDLLDMSRIISGKVRLEVKPLDLPSLARVAIDTVRPAADAKGVRLHLDCRPDVANVAGDTGRLQQVLWNLLTNAIKFTPKGGDVRLGVTNVAQCDGIGPCVEIVVSDTGQGITPEFLPYVFDRFRQADASITRKHGGLGLGLAIVKSLVESHGGGVRVQSEGTNCGATFAVALPTLQAAKLPPDVAVRPPGDEETKSAAAVASVAGLRVLVVDDEPDARGLVKRLLEDRDAVVTTVGSASEAMASLTGGQQPDVLVSDIGMPGEDGYALIARVRAAGLAVPAVALTAYARDEDRHRAILAGFQTHLAKPVNAISLMSTIAEITGRAVPKSAEETTPQ
ncbi:MAG: PAS domain S-box protein [Tepidisphaeraceae bacterium]